MIVTAAARHVGLWRVRVWKDASRLIEMRSEAYLGERRVMGDGMKIYIRILVGFFIFTSLSACSNSVPIQDAELDIQKPFGFSWDKLSDLETDTRENCKNEVLTVDLILTDEQIRKAIKLCIAESYERYFFPENETPKAFSEGELSVELIAGDTPIQYNYSFLHDWTGQDAPKKQKLRNKHASYIKSILRRRYGQPFASGYYDQSTDLGYQVANSKNALCDYWLVNKVGIFLCSHRIIYLDGEEMSLAFIRLDNQGRSKNLLENIFEASSNSSEFQENNQTKTAGVLENIVRARSFLNKHDKNQCTSSDLTPLANHVTIEETKLDFLRKIQTKSPDELALYAIERLNERNRLAEENISDREVISLLMISASSGSAIALNEVGLSLLDCKLGVKRDIEYGIKLLEDASSKGDVNAKYNIAQLVLSGRIETENRNQKVLELLSFCSESECKEEYSALNALLSL